VKPFFVYLLKCSDDSFYCGHTDDMELQMQQHAAGVVAYTADRKPLQLLWQGEFETRAGALEFELKVKGWTRAKKEALIRGDWEGLTKLARSTRAREEGDQALRQAQDERMRGQGERGQAQDERGQVQGERNLGKRGLAEGERERVHGDPIPPTVRAEPVEASSPAPRASTEHGLIKDVITPLAPALQRRAIAKAITLLESTRTDHRAQADELLTALLPHTGNSFRLGISGVPGVGKSTFIEVLGLYLIEQGHRVAVLTIDPSSTVSGGSILGDKTRMEKLSVHERAYIRPSPSSGTLGGVAEKTREAMLVCEAAGYDVVIVETVGVGQSETAVANMTDMFVLMQLPNAGDDLQAIKKGVMEIADLVVINKADIDANAAMRAEAQITSAMRLFGLVNNAMGQTQAAAYDQQWHPRVVQLSALHGTGIAPFWAAVTGFRQLQEANGKAASRRQQQALSWMWERIEAGLKQAFRENPYVSERLPAIIAQVTTGQLAASTAARQLLMLAGGSFSSPRN
jgi:LAO/AO transport system kinase